MFLCDVCELDFCNVFCFQCEGTFFSEECTRKACFSVALHPSVAAVLPSSHIRKTLSSLTFFLPVFTSWQEGVHFLASCPGVYVYADLPTFRAFKGGQTEKIKMEVAESPSLLVTGEHLTEHLSSTQLVMLVRIRGLSVFQVWTCLFCLCVVGMKCIMVG